MTLMVTQLVSGVWHGLYPGYILFFAGSAVFFAHSTVIYNWEKALMPPWLANSLPWWAFKVFCTKQGLDFLAMAFPVADMEGVYAGVGISVLAAAAVHDCCAGVGPGVPCKGTKAEASWAGSWRTAAAHQERHCQQQPAASTSSGACHGRSCGNGNGEEVVTGDVLHLGEGIKSALVDGSGSRQDLVSNGA